MARQGAGGAQDEIVRIGLQGGGERAVDGEGEGLGRFGGDEVTDGGEDDEAVEQMVAVGAAAGDVKEEVDLGQGGLAEQ